MAQFEGYERREAKILGVLKEYGISSIDECKEITLAKGIDVDQIVRSTQPICFENASWAYTVGAAIAIKMRCTKALPLSVSVSRASAFPVLLPRTVRLVSVTVISVRDFFPRRQSASHSLQATSHSQLQRVLSRSLLMLTRLELSRFVLSLTVSVRTQQ